MPDHSPSSETSFARMGEERFVSLTTFRRSGVPVSTPVWVAVAEDGALVVTTGADSGKVKRLRHDARVELRPCSRRGGVDPGAPCVTGVATIVVEPARIERDRRALAEKYGLEFRLMTIAEQLLRRERAAKRVILRLAEIPSSASASADRSNA